MDNDAVAEEMAGGPRTVAPARRAVITATVVLSRTGTHTEENSAGNAQGARGRGRGNQASGRNRKGRCRYCHNSTERWWQNCTLCLSHEAADAKEQANAKQESTSHAWLTQVQEDSSELEDFTLVVRDNTQVENAPAAAQPEERAAGDVQAQETIRASSSTGTSSQATAR